MIQTKEANIDKLGGFMIIKLENSVQIYESYEPGCFFFATFEKSAWKDDFLR
jgi:hypothetical protein